MERGCAGCGFAYDSVAPDEVADEIAAAPAAYREAFARADPARVARRPAPETWSPLEYACHVRDVLLVQRDRAVRALVEDTPAFARMHRDERVALCAYAAEPPEAVLGGLEVAAVLFARVLGALDANGWARPLRYWGPDGEVADLTWMGRHTVHECRHHLGDVKAGLGGADA